MTREDFMLILRALQEEEIRIRETKGVEYAGFEDALANFKIIGGLLGLSPKVVCLVYLTKHFLAIMNSAKLGLTSLSESLHSRIVDLRLYTALYLALVAEELRND